MFLVFRHNHAGNDGCSPYDCHCGNVFADSDGCRNDGNEGQCKNVVGGKNRSQLFHYFIPNQVAKEVAENAEAQEIAYDHWFLEGIPRNGVCCKMAFGSKAEVVQCENGKGGQKSVEENFSDGEKCGILAPDFFCAVGVDRPGYSGAEGQHVTHGRKLQDEFSVKHHQDHSHKGDEGSCNLPW